MCRPSPGRLRLVSWPCSGEVAARMLRKTRGQPTLLRTAFLSRELRLLSGYHLPTSLSVHIHCRDSRLPEKGGPLIGPT